MLEAQSEGAIIVLVALVQTSLSVSIQVQSQSILGSDSYNVQDIFKPLLFQKNK
jgi:hypothetical protein